ncbi:nucleotidyltransferase domain-containing protein [Hahella sp. CR1]|uniref:nucleotidyltransferase domain-containing protein n=1 Tax=Hahella sp. CR1 TaxID=2992807 RepID=UPI00244257A0|nr:nucleotidyltransferase domain-containing protein [Hahella sp. CR1]MDG9666330.1 nucleotidyltransferase domain-containing protein [Hahella sp. CR1]
MEKRIQETLERIEWEHDVKVLYACESGSRAWGFASRDSDYDVRFIYQRSLSHYLSLGKRRDVIELPIDDELDVSGWDISKALTLLRSGSATLQEWLNSPIVYSRDVVFLAQMKYLASLSARPASLFYHYFSMARNERERLAAGEVNAKRYAYMLRTLLAAMWVAEYRTPPPVRFYELKARMLGGGPIVTEVDALLERKAMGNEKEVIRPVLAIDCFADAQFEALETVRFEPVDKLDLETMDRFFMQMLNAA